METLGQILYRAAKRHCSLTHTTYHDATDFLCLGLARHGVTRYGKGIGGKFGKGTIGLLL